MRQGLGRLNYFGIDSRDPAVQSQIVALRDMSEFKTILPREIIDAPNLISQKAICQPT